MSGRRGAPLALVPSMPHDRGAQLKLARAIGDELDNLIKAFSVSEVNGLQGRSDAGNV